MASYLHRTATTAYPCCLPALGDLAGAGRIRLAGAKIGKKFETTHWFTTFFISGGDSLFYSCSTL